MFLFYIILLILFFISLLFFIICISTLEIEIKDLWFNSDNKKRSELINYLFYIRIKLLDKITLFKIKIDKEKVKRIENSKIFKSKFFSNFSKYTTIEEFVEKNKDKIFRYNNIKYIKDINIEFKKINLYMQICTTDSIFTSFLVAIIASVLSIILARNIKRYDKNKYDYVIRPGYEDRASFKIKLNCIIGIKIVHIMNVIYMLTKKRSVEYDERTSNRRTYVCSNSKYSRYG